MKTIIRENLRQLTSLLKNISKEHYTQQVEILSGSTIGQHIRHTLEFYLILTNEKAGSICYDNRKHDKQIESSLESALKTIDHITTEIENLDEKQSTKFEADYSENGTNKKSMKSSIAREMAYCLEHSIHHQALIKAGLISLKQKPLVDDNFGVAYSTIKFKNNATPQ
jgi:uncharacterized damage-inducible protein DinB